ncbi:MAG: Blue-light-activated protein [Gemmataceae bacterium]|nr:Blue-light-activated protein [Gemmataceae bacterium]
MNGGTGTEGPGPGTQRPVTVLLVEDQDAIRKLFQMALTAQGYRVVAAPAGEEAIRICSAHPGPVDVLVTDVNLPGMKGPELTRVLQGSRPGLKVLYLSGYGSDVCTSGPTGGMLHFLQKPFQLDVLARKVRDMLAPAPAGEAVPTPA